MKHVYTIFIFLALLSLSACRSAKKMYERGNYDEAVELAAKKVQKKPNDAGTIDLLRSAYRYAVDDHERRIANLLRSQNELRWESAYQEYASLQRLFDVIHSYPAVYEIVRPMDYGAALSEFGEKAGRVRFDRGMALMQGVSKNDFRQAFFEFRQALNYLPGDRKVQQKMDEAFETAVTNVVMQPLVQTGFQFGSYNSGIVSFDQQLLRSLNNSGNLFVRYLTPAEAASLHLRVDQVVDMRISPVDIDRVREDHFTRELSREVVVREKIVRPDSVVKEYATVRGRITTIHKTVRAEAMIELSVRDASGQWLWTDTRRGEFGWTTEFSRFSGDERVLGPEEKKKLECRETWPPERHEVERIVMDDARQKASCALRDYFARY